MEYVALSRKQPHFQLQFNQKDHRLGNIQLNIKLFLFPVYLFITIPGIINEGSKNDEERMIDS